MRPVYITRAGVLGTILALAVAALCVRLGFWQLDRLAQRQAHNEAVAARMGAPPLTGWRPRGDTTGQLYRTVILGGHYDNARTVLLAGREYRGRRGVHVITPLRLEAGGAVLVNRGWLPAVDPRDVEPERYRKAGVVHVRGLILSLRSGQNQTGDRPMDAAAAAENEFRRVWYRLSGSGLEGQLPYSISDVYVQRLPGAGAEAGAGGAPDVTADAGAGGAPDVTAVAGAGPGADAEGRAAPFPLSRPSLGEGRHLGYAIQWFSFAAVALIGWAVLALRKGELGRRGPAEGELARRQNGR